MTGEVAQRPAGEIILEPQPRVVLLDVRPERRKVIRAIIEQTVGIGTVVAEAGTLGEAVSAIDAHLAGTAVVEIQLPVAEGLAAIAALREAHATLRIVVCSFHGDAGARLAAEQAGADCYLTKPVSGRDLRRALESGHVVPLVTT